MEEGDVIVDFTIDETLVPQGRQETTPPPQHPPSRRPSDPAAAEDLPLPPGGRVGPHPPGELLHLDAGMVPKNAECPVT